MEEQASTLAANWTGDTSSLFGQALANYIGAYGTVIAGWQSIVTIINQNRGIYQATNDSNQQAASSVLGATQSLSSSSGLSALG
jgi:hypothetical protein